MNILSDNGLATVTAHRSVDEVVAFLSATLAAKGISLFALVDHSGEAAKVGLALRPTKLLIFGDPKAGTPLMEASILSAIDLPLKILVWEDEAGETQLTYNRPDYLGQRHQLPADLLKNIAAIETLVTIAAQQTN